MILLACATWLECSKALTRASLSHATREPAPVHFGGQVFLPCEVGIGPVAAALSVGGILEKHPEITGILNLGICGSFDTTRAPLGQACVASAEIWPEYGVHSCAPEQEEPFTHQMLPALSLDPVNRIDLDPLQAASSMHLSLDAKWPTGPSLTVAGVSGDRQRAETLRSRTGGLTENMEGFSLALAARRRGLAFLEIRTVSNPAGARDKGLWDFRLAFAALQDILPALVGEPA
jgi:futalosine hydrolase